MPMPSTTLDCTPYRETFNDLKAALPILPRIHLPAFFSRVSALSDELPLQVRRAVSEFKAHGNEDGFLYISGLPVDEDSLPSTPTATPAPIDRPLLEMEAWISLFAALLGKTTGYQGNRGGSVFQDVYPAPGAHAMTANGYSKELRYHTEMAYHAYQPHYLVIGCSRADHDRVAKTLVTSIRKVVRRLSEEDKDVLRRVPLPWHVDLAFRSDANPDPMTHLLLLTDNDDGVRYDRALINPAEAGEAANALRAFSAAMDASAAELRLCPGDIIIVDNFRTSHSRIAYTPRFDGKDRWLNRVFVRSHDNDTYMEHGEVVPFQLRAPDQPVFRTRPEGTLNTA